MRIAKIRTARLARFSRQRLKRASDDVVILSQPWYDLLIKSRKGVCGSPKDTFQVYMACVVSVLLYGCETWTAYRHQERRLNAFHMRCLRSTLGLSWKDRVPNTSVLQTTGSYDLITVIRHRRLRWAGHV